MADFAYEDKATTAPTEAAYDDTYSADYAYEDVASGGVAAATPVTRFSGMNEGIQRPAGD